MSDPRFEPTLESLRTHAVPRWYEDAKLGIFIHWSLFSVPAWAPVEGTIDEVLRDHYDDFMALTPYADWYENAMKLSGSPTARHHSATYGDALYDTFREPFVRALDGWDPDAWAQAFRAAGAGYVVLVTKHHDGFCLWPSDVPNPHRAGWHTERDVVGDLARAVRAQGMRFGVYYSGGIDWSFKPEPVRNLGEFFASIAIEPEYAEYADAQCRELIERYQPDVLWNDIAWPAPRRKLYELLADYYAAVPEGVVNDRWIDADAGMRWLRRAPVRALFNWGVRRSLRKATEPPKPPSSRFHDFTTPEYTSFDAIQEKKWESTRGLGHSFCYNRNEPLDFLLSEEDLVRGFVDIVSKNGNLLLNVGPRGEDATLAPEQAQRLAELGRWMARNGEAIRGTRPWRRAEGTTRCGIPLRFTSRSEGSQSEDVLYAILVGDEPPTADTEALVLRDVPRGPGGTVRLLGGDMLSCSQEGADLKIDAPTGGWGRALVGPAAALEIR